MRRLRRITRVRRERKGVEKRLYIQQLVGVAILGLIAGVILTKSIFDAGHKNVLPRASSEVVGQVIEVKADERQFCYDPISCIRDVGEELGVKNQDIMTMIRIGKCESGYRPEAMGINTNKTADRGVFQINTIHKTLSNEAAFNYELNIRYAYKMFIKQGDTPWHSSVSCWNK